jgi:hypothetical protein
LIAAALLYIAMMHDERTRIRNAFSSVPVRGLWQYTFVVFVVLQVSFLLFFRDDTTWEMTGGNDDIPDSSLVPWDLEDTLSLATGNVTCGVYNLQDQVDTRIRRLGENCPDLIVYGAALDQHTLELFHHAMEVRQNYSRSMLETHGRCFFLFVGKGEHQDSLIGHFWVVSLPSLPYGNEPQNVNFVKYAAPWMFFRKANTFIWQDPAVFFATQNVWKQPFSYQQLTSRQVDVACLSAIAMPINEWNVGNEFVDGQNSHHGMFQAHCRVMAGYTGDSAMSDTLLENCRQYMRRYNVELLDQTMLTTSFMVWKNDEQDNNQSCRRFNTQFQCTMLHELHHHPHIKSDTVVLPTVAAQLAPKKYHKERTYNRQIHELHMCSEEFDSTCPRITVIRSNCHWNRGDSFGSSCNYWRHSFNENDMLPLPFGNVENHTINVIDDNTCTSPERSVGFPVHGDIPTYNNGRRGSNHTCGLKASNPISAYLREELRTKQLPQIMDSCNDLVVYGVALGKHFVENIYNATTMDPQRSHLLLQRHGKCFVMFVSQRDVPKSTLQGHFLLVPIPQWVLPYQNDRRNTKLLKYMGSLLFPNTTTLIWQDAKFFSEGLRNKQPTNYHALIQRQRKRPKTDSCLTAFGLPVHPNTMGMYHPSVLSGDSRPDYRAHCNTVVRAIWHRPNVTDSVDSVAKQCVKYVHSSGANHTLDNAMVDTAFIIWNHNTAECRTFNNRFRCTLLSETHCHSDRDQIPWPFVLHLMGLVGHYDRNGKMVEVNDDWNPRAQDLEMQHTGDSVSVDVMVTIVRSNCHWYKTAIGKGCNFWDLD